jgi:hypothetical protein
MIIAVSRQAVYPGPAAPQKGVQGVVGHDRRLHFLHREPGGDLLLDVHHPVEERFQA